MPSKIGGVSAFDEAIAEELANGGRPDARSVKETVIVYGAGNVLLHLTFAALSVVVSWYFVFPWIV